MTSKLVELFPSPAADFDHPLEILDSCHQRIRRYCALLGRLVTHLATHGQDEEALATAKSILRYFNEAGRNHHLDEEQDLFPALIEAASEKERVALEVLLTRLRSEHRSLDALWGRMCSRLEALVRGHAVLLTEAAAHNFAEAYEQHICLEESALLPLARRLLDAPALAHLGASMAARRKTKVA